MCRLTGCGQKISLLHYIIGLVVCHRKDPETGTGKYHDAFASAFHKEKNLKCWEGLAVPPTHAYLKSLCREVGDAGPENEMQIAMAEMKDANTIDCNILTVQGFDENML